MVKISKNETPDYWTEYIRKDKKITYKKMSGTEDGRELQRKLKKTLIKEQHRLCAYCCGILDENKSHNEHIKPQSSYPKLSMDYHNIVSSCSGMTCGMAKENKYDENLFVTPLEDGCEKHFRYEPDGTIIGTDEAGLYTINLLKLNSRFLKDSRKAVYRECCAMGDADLVKKYYMDADDEGNLPRYVDMVTYFYQMKFF